MREPLAIQPGSLYADWQRRRESLAEYQGPREQLHAAHLQVLDYLLHRYREDAAALQPAPPVLDTVYVNQRAIVVHHHLGAGRIGGVKNRDEATHRVTAIVERMQATFAAPTEPGGASDFDFAIDEPDPPEHFLARQQWLELDVDARQGTLDLRATQSFLNRHPSLPPSVVALLRERLVRLQDDTRTVAQTLAMCRNRNVVRVAALGWRAVLAAGIPDDTGPILRRILHQAGPSGAEEVRPLFADRNAVVRFAAYQLLGEIGALGDTSLYSDLLLLPPLDDEAPNERIALTTAMRRLAERDHAAG